MVSYYFMAGMYIALGAIHFSHPKFYLPIMPQFLPAPMVLIYASGAAEIALGLGLLFSETKLFALWGIIAMLISFFLVHVNMLFPGNRLGFPLWVLWIRVLLQFGLIYWAYAYL